MQVGRWHVRTMTPLQVYKIHGILLMNLTYFLILYEHVSRRPNSPGVLPSVFAASHWVKNKTRLTWHQ